LVPLLEALAEVDDVRKYIPKFVTVDHKVDFQRASYILSNAIPRTKKNYFSGEKTPPPNPTDFSELDI
jgi:hypothetical protein